MKKIISVLLIACMMVLAIVPETFAGENNIAEMDNIGEVFNELNKNGFDYVLTSQRNGVWIYESHTEELYSRIAVSKGGNGEVEYVIDEGYKHDEVTIYADGTISLNGNVVSVTTEVVIDLENSAGSIMPRASRYDIVTACPYGSPSDYINSTTQIKTVDIGNNQTYSSITAGAFALIVGALFGLQSAAIGSGAGFGANVALDWLKTHTPNGHASKIKDTRRTHRDGFVVTDSLAVAMHDYIYYTIDDVQIYSKRFYEKFIF